MDKELRKQLRKAVSIFPEELKYDLPNSIGTTEMEALEKVVQQERLLAKIEGLMMARYAVKAGSAADMHIDAMIKAMSRPKTDQEDLIAFVKDPANIAKAAEGSMAKRQAVIDRNTPTNGDLVKGSK